MEVGHLKSLGKISVACVMSVGMMAGTAQVTAPVFAESTSVEHAALIEASKAEEGLLVYSNIAEYNWRYILDGFQEEYPWIKLESIDLGPSTVFERYYSETSVGKNSADIIATAAPDGWTRFIERGELAEYRSPEADSLPTWSMRPESLYTISVDPMIIIYNKMLVDEGPDSFEELVEMVQENPDKYRNKVTTYNALKHSFAYDIHWSAVKYLGNEGWPVMDALGSVTRAESGGAVMVEKVTSGEYSMGYFVSGITVFPRMKQAGRDKIMGWELMEDGTPVFHREIGVTKKAKSPNSAKLFLNYILSHEGQIAVGKGGMTPYRSDVTHGQVPYLAYQDIVDEIGEENIIHVKYDAEAYEKRDEFLARWKQAFRIQD
ncbi:ABC transporter substrate-binding protein [Kordiimonas sp.]|uniref:ABC transporter substrate-binding protein n=1 Tax=Kordiimonas sp. TaxID=1970157 RepID=UPI003A8DE992